MIKSESHWSFKERSCLPSGLKLDLACNQCTSEHRTGRGLTGCWTQSPVLRDICKRPKRLSGPSYTTALWNLNQQPWDIWTVLSGVLTPKHIALGGPDNPSPARDLWANGKARCWAPHPCCWGMQWRKSPLLPSLSLWAECELQGAVLHFFGRLKEPVQHEWS